MNQNRILAVSAIIAASFGALLPVAQAAPADKHVQLLVKPKSTMKEAALHALLSANGASEHGKIHALDVRVIRVPAKAADKVLNALKRNRDVEYAEPDATARAISTANDPHYTQGYQWYLSKIQAPTAWTTTTGSSAIVVAVLDTGVLATHPDLSGKVLAGYDFVNNDTDAADDHGHGTAVAGLTSAATNNGVGMAAVSWANPVLPVKVLGADGSGTYSGISNGITWAADNGARIINLSLGGTSSSQTLQDAVNYAWNRNVIVIAAAGNNGNDTLVYPAACNNVVAVSATDSSDNRPSWSNFGSYVDVSAPGVSVLSLQGTDGYAHWNGTSFSSPVTAGVVALMTSANPQLSNSGIVDALLKNSDDIGAAGYDVYFGHGRVNANKAVAAVTSTPADTIAPTVAIDSPSDGAILSGSVDVSVSASDNVGVSRIELYIGGVLYAESSTSSASFTWNTTNSQDGTYTLEARAYDAANNVSSTSIRVDIKNSSVVDIIAPAVAITSLTDGSILKGKVVKVAVKGTDNVEVTRMELYIDGKLHAASSTGSALFNWNTSKVSRGAHKLQAYAYDAAGNIGTSHLITVYK